MAKRIPGVPVATKLGQAVLVLILVSFGTTLLLGLIPGSAALLILGPSASSAAIARFNAQHGYDRPLFVRYGDWLSHALHGDLGNSIQSNTPVLHLIGQALPVTAEIAILAMLLALAIAIPLACAAAARAGGIADRLITGLASVLISVPAFVSSVLLLYLISVRARILPPNGWVALSSSVPDNIRHAALPVLTLVLAVLPLFLRVLRGDIVAVLNENYVMTARARGLPEWYILLSHVLRPASRSLLTVSGLSFGYLFGGSIIVETYYAVPGLGQLTWNSVSGKDVPVVQGIVVLAAVTFVVVNGIIDVLAGVIDPRLRVRTAS